MPLYEYVCHNCKVKFERLRPMGDSHDAECHRCGRPAGRVLSVFASFSRTEGGDLAPISGGGGCAACSAGSCAGCGAS